VRAVRLPMSDQATTGRRAVVLCDRAGRAVGEAGVLDVHQGSGALHKAFSVVIFRRNGAEVLLQQRSRQKALFPLRWANTCCSHLAPNATVLKTAQRRLREEFGFSVPLQEAGSFVYRARDAESDLTEYEHDTVLIGAGDDVLPQPDPTEISAWRWMPVVALQRDLVDASDRYAPWLPQALQLALGRLDGVLS